MALTVLLPENPYSRELLALLTPLLPPDSQIRDPDAGLEGLAGQRLLFALALDESGCSESGYRMLMTLRRSQTLLEGCVAGLVVTGRGELYTKDAARDLVFAANQAGCAFLGRPLVEATGSLRNFRVQAQIGGTDEETAFRAAVSELLERLTAWEGPAPVGRVLALHASQRSTWCADPCRRRCRCRRSACGTGPWPTATDAATPPVCTSGSGVGASMAGLWWRRCIRRCAPATRW